MQPRRLALPAVLLAAALTLAACNHTPIGANAQTPFPSASSANDAGRLIVEALGQTRYVSAEAFLAPSLQSAMPDTALKSKWDGLATQYGKFKGVSSVTSTPDGPNTDVSVTAMFAYGSAIVQAIVDPTFKVTQLTIPTTGVAPPVTPAPSASGAASGTP
jgi:hypothetical protein